MKNLVLVVAIALLFTSCADTIDNTGTCSDGIKNQGEQGVDCGGPCGAVCPSCADGLMNQNESAVDCGGPCDPCYPRLTANMNDTAWSSTSRNAMIFGPGMIRIYGTNQLTNLTLFYSGPFAPGTIPAGSQFRAEYRDENGALFETATEGSITFSTFDTTQRVISGIFSFTAANTNGNSVHGDHGVFNVLEY